MNEKPETAIFRNTSDPQVRQRAHKLLGQCKIARDGNILYLPILPSTHQASDISRTSLLETKVFSS